MDDEILRRRLREKIKNPRVRRMLNLDNIIVEKDNRQDNKSTDSPASRPGLNEKDYNSTDNRQDNKSTDSPASRPGLNEKDYSTGSPTRDISKRSDGDELFTGTPLKRRRQDIVQQHEDDVYEDLEEPFSPVVSVYNPTSTSDSSDSDESIELNTRKRGPYRKMGLAASICQTAIEYENVWEENEGDLSKSPLLSDNNNTAQQHF
ncbi:uncharacterized protein LOC114365983 [Ostrinia furnacalis]|uniref:uncharacterized protein LOC114365983 n=1 Tax=Ostrinia furnacalis TaxID=93504 RepID=UPI00103C5A18|nr:uncharacterized protein LOC114365983 [Ostrinia furnacalis]